MEDMDPPGCPELASVVIFNISPLANLDKSDNRLRDPSSSFSASNLFSLIISLHSPMNGASCGLHSVIASLMGQKILITYHLLFAKKIFNQMV
jgi:hypothetical protein